LHLKAQLEAIGFKPHQEDINSFLFISKNVIYLVFVDETLFYSPKVEYIDEAIEQLRGRGMDHEVEGEVAGFLGAHMNRNAINSSITLTQSG
jgi:hypothetical protein